MSDTSSTYSDDSDTIVYQCRLCPNLILKKEETDGHRLYHRERGDIGQKKVEVKKKDGNQVKANPKQVSVDTSKPRKRRLPRSTSTRETECVVVCFEPIPLVGSSRRVTPKNKRKRVNKRAIRKLSCQICGRGFPWQWNLDTHVRTHTGERPFACTICELRFKQRTHLVRHLAAVHRYPTKKGSDGSKNLSQPGSVELSCCFCGDPFQDKGAVRKHISKDHKNLVS